jgi:hypothetical protein
VLRNVAGGWRLFTHPDSQASVERFILSSRQARLTKASLETLAIVAYKQPVTRHQVSSIRGVNSDGVLRALTDRGLIEEAGRDEGPGRPLLYGTTPQFLERLGLPSLAALPSLPPCSTPALVTSTTRRSSLCATKGRATRTGTWSLRPDPATTDGRGTSPACARARGYGSRRTSEELIAQGKVRVNGRIATLGDKIDVTRDEVTLGGAPGSTWTRKRDTSSSTSLPACSPRCATSAAAPISDRSCRRRVLASSPWDASTGIPRACCCSPTTGSLPSASPTLATGIEKEYLGRGRRDPPTPKHLSGGSRRRDARRRPRPREVRPARRRATGPGPGCRGDDRGTESRGAATVGRGRPPGHAAGPGPHRPDQSRSTEAGRTPGPHRGRAARAPASRRRSGTLARRTSGDGGRSPSSGM